jgi:protein SCO1/2
MRSKVLPRILAAFIAASAPATGADHIAHEKPAGKISIPSEQAVRELKPSLLFGLKDHQGRVVDASTYTNKSLIVFFGFTSCPSICPVGMNNIAEARRQIGSRYGTNVADKIQPVFITTDPKKDTLQRMDKWLKYVSEGAVGLTGTEGQLATVGQKFRAINPNGGHHSPYAYLFDSAGVFQGIFDTQNGPEALTLAIANCLDPLCAPSVPKQP